MQIPVVEHDEATVLIIDDENAVRMVLARMLTQLGFTVLTAESGQEGIDTFRSHLSSISTILLDVMMPHMSGATAFHELHALNESVRIILMSGYDEQETLQRVGVPTIASFLQKPFTIADLRRIMQR